MLLNAENGAWTHDSVHGKPYKLCWTWQAWNDGILPNQKACNGLNPDTPTGASRFYRTHYDHGLCGVSDGYKKHIYEDERFATNWKWQVEKCHELYKGGTTFYGWNHRKTRGKNIVFNQ